MGSCSRACPFSNGNRCISVTVVGRVCENIFDRYALLTLSFNFVSKLSLQVPVSGFDMYDFSCVDTAIQMCGCDCLNLDPSGDDDDVSTTTRRQRQSSTSVYPALYPSPPVSPEDADPFMYHTSAAAAVRTRSIGKDEPAKDVTKIKDKYIRHGSLPVSKRFVCPFSLYYYCGEGLQTKRWTKEDMERGCAKRLPST